MAKKPVLSLTTVLENIENFEKQLAYSVSNIFRNVTNIADIFFPQPSNSKSEQTIADNEKNSTNITDSRHFNGTPTVYYNDGDITQEENSPDFISKNHEWNSSSRVVLINESPGEQVGHSGIASIYADVQNAYLRVLENSCLWLLTFSVLYIVNRFLIKSKFLDSVIKCVGSWVFVMIASPGIILLLFPTLFARLCTKIYLKIRYDNKVFLAHPMDASWAHESPYSPSTMTGLYIIKGKGDLTKIRTRIAQCLEIKFGNHGELLFDRLKCALRQHLGFICWERLDEFRLENHVKLMSEKNPEFGRDKDGQVVSVTDRDLFDELARIHDEEPLSKNPNASPWEIIVVPNFKHGTSEEEHYALVFRIHHSVMDGVSTGNAIHAGMADKEFKFSVDPIEPLKVPKFQQWMAYIISALMMPWVTLKNLSLKEKHRFHGPTLTGKKYFCWSRAVRLDTLKLMKNETRTSVFSVLMACLGGSFRNLFLLKGEKVPDIIHAAPPVAILPFPDRRPRNRFSIILFPLKVGAENCLERLDAVCKASKDLARSSDILANFYVMNILGMMPNAIIKILGHFAHATMTLSNIPGPSETVTFFGGDPLIDVGAWVPVKNTIGIGMALFSYSDRVRVTIVADEACLNHKTDVEFLKSEFENQLTELAGQIGIKQEMFLNDM